MDKVLESQPEDVPMNSVGLEASQSEEQGTTHNQEECLPAWAIVPPEPAPEIRSVGGGALCLDNSRIMLPLPPLPTRLDEGSQHIWRLEVAVACILFFGFLFMVMVVVFIRFIGH